jgi:hypothetical protein
MAGIVEGLRDGFPTIVTLTGAGVTFWEVTLQPPGIDGGEAIPTTTMRNSDLRTSAPRHLYGLTPSEISAAYDPTAYDSILAAVNINQSIIVTFPDGGTLTFWGFIQRFVPDANEEGRRPTARITIVPTNRNASGVETAPVVAAGSGTGA